MRAVLSRKIYQHVQVAKHASNFKSEKNAGNVLSEQNVGKFEPEKNASKFGPKKMPVFSGEKKLQAYLRVCEKTFIQECICKVMNRIQLGHDFFSFFLSSPDFLKHPAENAGTSNFRQSGISVIRLITVQE